MNVAAITKYKPWLGVIAENEAWTMAVTGSILNMREISYLSFRSPELGQPFWSFLPLVVAGTGVRMSNPKTQVNQKSDPFRQQETFKNDPASTFSQDEIRTRAYQIYESRNRNGNQADQDWSQAETELMELVHAR